MKKLITKNLVSVFLTLWGIVGMCHAYIFDHNLAFYIYIGMLIMNIATWYVHVKQWKLNKLNNLKIGHIESFDEDEIICRLRIDYELDEELTYGRGLLTDEQNKLVSVGLCMRYNKEKGTVELMTDELGWC